MCMGMETLAFDPKATSFTIYGIWTGDLWVKGWSLPTHVYRVPLVTIADVVTKSVLSEIEAGSSNKSLHVGPILWLQVISLILRLNF